MMVWGVEAGLGASAFHSLVNLFAGVGGKSPSSQGPLSWLTKQMFPIQGQILRLEALSQGSWAETGGPLCWMM